MKCRSAAVAGLLTLIAWPRPAQAEQTIHRIPVVQQLPSLEDFLEDTPPEHLLRLDDFVQRAPGDGTAASQVTVAFLFRDHRALHVVFVCHDADPSGIRAQLTRREAAVPDDLVGILLDTFHDQRRAYLFMSNPRGVQRDAIVTDGRSEDYSFDTVWQSTGQLTDTGYLVWLTVPFRSLRFDRDEDGTWGVGLIRRIPRTSEELSWPLISHRQSAVVPQLASVGGFGDVVASSGAQLIPHGTFIDARTRSAARDPFERTHESQGGLDAKFVVAGRMAIDATIEPDFSQVESDEPQVTLNQRYEVYFPEKRPFFLESAGFFETPDALFFSRRIVDPTWGVRTTAKLGSWNVGSLVAEDRSAPEGAGSPRPLVGVARIQREVGRESSAGMLLTTRQVGTSRTTLASADGRFRLNPQWTMEVQASRSSHHSSTTGSSDGSALVAQVHAAGRHWTFVNRYVERSPAFVAPLGFIQRTDIRQVGQGLSYRWRPRNGTVHALGPGLTAAATWNYAGRPLDQVINPHFGLELEGGTQVLLSAFFNWETVGGRSLDTTSAQLHVSSSRLRWLEVAGFLQLGERINYRPAEGLQPFVGHARDGYVRITLRPDARLSAEQTILFADLDTMATPGTSRRTVFTHSSSRTKVSVQATRRLSVRTIVDYHVTRTAPDLTSARADRAATADVLVTYQVDPFTAVHGGYTIGLAEDEGWDAAWSGGSQPWRLPVRRRQVFFKVSYGLRF